MVDNYNGGHKETDQGPFFLKVVHQPKLLKITVVLVIYSRVIDGILSMNLMRKLPEILGDLRIGKSRTYPMVALRNSRPRINCHAPTIYVHSSLYLIRVGVYGNLLYLFSTSEWHYHYHLHSVSTNGHFCCPVPISSRGTFHSRCNQIFKSSPSRKLILLL